MRPRSLRLPVCAGPVPPDRAHARIDDPLDVRLEPHRALSFLKTLSVARCEPR
jgi:hypothetical protein